MESNEIIKDMIDSIETGKNSDAGENFNSLIQDKMTAALDARKIELAQNIYSRHDNEQEIDTVSEPDQGDEVSS